jgi:hypothetical protein
MSNLADISKVVSNMHRDMDRLGECNKLIASPKLVGALRKLLTERALNIGQHEPDFTGVLYFRGTPVIECSQLQDLEYAFVKHLE